MIDNIIVGNVIEGLTLDSLGIKPNENNLHISMDQAEDLDMFLPKILVHAGMFKSTSAIKAITKTRNTQKKIIDCDSRLLWRTITRPELTEFKIGKQYFWFVVGSMDK